MAPPTEPLLASFWALFQFLFWELIVPSGIFILAFLPRWSLAQSLDLITDESVYIPEGVREYLLLRSGDLANRNWLINYEAPPLAKLFIGGGSLWGSHVWPLTGWLLGARLPGVILGSAYLVIAYWLARPIFGRFPALLGALALALSPWVAYFAAIAYLDSYMVAFVTIAILLSWHAARRPKLLPLVAILLGLGFAAKYTGAFASIPIILYLAYYYVFVERRFAKPIRADGADGADGADAAPTTPAEEAANAPGVQPTNGVRRGPPWQFWLIPPIVLATIYVTDPAIWISPIGRLWNSMLFEFDHALNGHGVFWNDQIWEHVPPGEALYILFAKMSLFILIPAFLALPWATWRVVRSLRAPTTLDDRAAFALCWLGGMLPAFGLLTIVVGTHYMLPLAPAVTFTGAWVLVRACEWLAPRLVLLYARLIDTRAHSHLAVVGDAALDATGAESDLVGATAAALTAEGALSPTQPTTAASPTAALVPTTSRPATWRARLGWGAVSAGLATVLDTLRSTPARMGAPTIGGGWPATTEHTPHDAQAPRQLVGIQVVMLALLLLVTFSLTLPPAHGLATVPQAEGYTSEWLSGENQSLQVAYPGYTDALSWIVAHTHGRTSVTVIGTPGSLDVWIHYRQNLYPGRIRLAVGLVCAKDDPTPCPPRPQTMYVIWPMHLVQRQQLYPMPANWRSHVVATIRGGDTTYCYILRMSNA